MKFILIIIFIFLLIMEVTALDLGYRFTGKNIIFNLHATNAEKITLELKKTMISSAREFKMKNVNGNIWHVVLPLEFKDFLYRFKISRNNKIDTGIDPYAKCITSDKKWGIVCDNQFIVSESPVFDISESVIYELHIRDFTLDPDCGIVNRGKYISFLENDTCLADTNVKTGMSHLRELGVNVVQIMPFQVFDHDEYSDEYNWGYMPVHFNSPDGWFANRKDGTNRITEAKKMIDAFHRNGIKVIMDVVYNHTSENRDSMRFNFNVMAPDYYYRVKSDGTYSNGSGCGNELRSESLHGRKAILDSLKMWVTDYKVDGFRFDLMALLDKKTINGIIRELRKIKPDIMIYGEPWTCGDTPIEKMEKGFQKKKGWHVFNDDFRDALKGSVFDTGCGYLQDALFKERIKTGIKGSIETFTHDPIESINYVACHDNRTFYDRLKISTKDMKLKKSDLAAMNRLGAAILFCSQGIPFIHSGQEMLRTKNGEHNSYNRPDSINMVRWKWKLQNRSTYDYYRDLIQMRKDHPAFRMKSRDQVMKRIKFFDDAVLPENCIAWKIDCSRLKDQCSEIIVMINPNDKKVDFYLEELKKGKWFKLLDEKKYYRLPLRYNKTNGIVNKKSVLILGNMVQY